jgi:hypothetical protein
MARTVPWIIDYPIVLEQMRATGLRSLYYNGGAFGFGSDTPTRSIGWIGPPDDTIRAEVRPLIRQAPEPFEQNLTSLLVKAWAEILPGRIWVMPGSSWAYELDFGSRQWLPPLLERIGIDPGLLQSRTNAAAIEFSTDEHERLSAFAMRLLEMLQGSDFFIAFPGQKTVAMLHHHKQIWWTSADEAVIESLHALPPEA